MTDLISLGADVAWPDLDRATAVREALANRPNLGRLADIAEWAASVTSDGGAFATPRLVIIGGAAGDAAQHAAADAGIGVRVVTDLPDSPADALTAGAQITDVEVDRGADLLVVAAPYGVSSSSADAALAVSVLTNTEPVKVLARGAAATDPDAWMARAINVRDRRRTLMPLRDDPDQLLDALGSAPLAAVAGVVLQASVRRTPVILDGPGAVAGSLIGYLAQPRAARWWSIADDSPDPTHELAVARLGQQGMLGLRSGLGDGLAGVLAVAVARSAARLGA